MWAKDDLAWLSAHYPELRKKESGIIEGRLSFQMFRANGAYVVNPSTEQIQDLTPPDYLYLCDTYKIKITWEDDQKHPTAYEVGGRLEKVAERLGKTLLDMHQFSQNKALCLASGMDIDRMFKEGFRLEVYIEGLLIPYLFAQSHYAKTQKWLWGELSHGSLGLLEWLGRLEDFGDKDVGSTYRHILLQSDSDKTKALLAVRPRGHHSCPCGSKIKFRTCHPDVHRGIVRLRNAISRGLVVRVN